jgi:hypothetical protein
MCVDFFSKPYLLKGSNKQWGRNVLDIQEICKNSKVILKIEEKVNSTVCLAKVVLIPQSVTD